MNKKRANQIREAVLKMMRKHSIKGIHFKTYYRRAKKKFVLNLWKPIIIIMLLTTNAYADKIVVPFTVYPKEIQQLFKDKGYKLDLSGNERTEDSWGFIRNEGIEFTIYTYKGVTGEELEMIKKTVFESTR